MSQSYLSTSFIITNYIDEVMIQIIFCGKEYMNRILSASKVVKKLLVPGIE